MIYPPYARFYLAHEINQCDTSHQQVEKENHMIIEIDSEKTFDKL